MRRTHRNPLLAAAAVALLGAAGCGSPDPQSAIDEFEANRARAQRRIDEAEARQAAFRSPAGPDGCERFVDDWEERWTGIEREVKKLKKELGRLVKAFDRHFARMEKLALSIKTPEIRGTEQSKNAELHRRWVATVTEANGNLRKMEEQIGAAKDVPKVLQLAQMRGEVEAKIIEVRALSRQLRGTAAELEKVTTEGRALIR